MPSHLAEGLAQIKGITIDPEKVVTNIVIFDVRATGRTADGICADLGEASNSLRLIRQIRDSHGHPL